MSHTQFSRRLGALMLVIGFALTIAIGGWSLGALLLFGLFIGAVIFLVNRETGHTLDATDRELAEQRMVRRLAREERRRTDGGWRG